MSRWLVVSPEGKVTVRTDKPSLKSLQTEVGGYLEALRLPQGRGYIYINEEGKLKGLRYNPIATEISGGIDIIVGPALVVGPPDGRGDETDVVPKTEALVRSLARSWVE